MRGYFRPQVVLHDYRPNFANQPGQPFHFGGGSDEGSIVCLRGAIDKGCTRQRLDGARKAKAASHLGLAAEANPIRELVV